MLANPHALQTAQSMLTGTRHVALAADVPVQTQRHRDLMKLAFAGDRNGADAQLETCGQMEAALAALQSALGERPALKLDELWRPTRRASALHSSAPRSVRSLRCSARCGIWRRATFRKACGCAAPTKCRWWGGRSKP